MKSKGDATRASFANFARASTEAFQFIAIPSLPLSRHDYICIELDTTVKTTAIVCQQVRARREEAAKAM